MRRNIFTIVFMGLICATYGVSTDLTSSGHDIYHILPEQFRWISSPALPKEIKVAIIYGDPEKEGPLVMRLKIPAGSKIAPHWHHIDENITVLFGSINIGNGDKFDKQNSIHLTERGFASIPPNHHHYAWFNEDTVLQLNNYGRWQINYVNPDDDPRNQKKE